MPGSRIFLALVLAAAALPAHSFGGHARITGDDSWVDSTHLIELRQGSPLSQKASQLRSGSLELAGGESVGLRGFYDAQWKDVHAMWMTQVTENIGILFGGSTGERAQKYTISPSLKLGVLFQARPSPNLLLSFRATKTLGGSLREKTCTADYGEIGGVQKVNCRLAASTLDPAETLQYLVYQRPLYRQDLSLTLTYTY